MPNTEARMALRPKFWPWPGVECLVAWHHCSSPGSVNQKVYALESTMRSEIMPTKSHATYSWNTSTVWSVIASIIFSNSIMCELRRSSCSLLNTLVICNVPHPKSYRLCSVNRNDSLIDCNTICRIIQNIWTSNTEIHCRASEPVTVLW